MSSQIQIGVSSCLLGNKVRYDGEHSRNDCVANVFNEIFELLPFCPEVAIGLGIPRPPIQLVSFSGEIRVRGVSDANHDVTDALTKYAENIFDEFYLLSGYIFKSRSPSCGVSDTPVYDSKTNQSVAVSAGQFAKIIILQHPALPVADEKMLVDKKLRDDFVRRVKRFHNLRS